MAYLLVRHQVKNYSSWKDSFIEHRLNRQKSGSRGGFVFRNADKPDEVLILLEWDDQEGSREFAQSSDLKEAMERAGVCDEPDVYFLEEVARPAM
jgi:heme-degrading monooxygenase HmoA